MAEDLSVRANYLALHICGMVSWTCRHCGAWNRRRVRSTTFHARCSNRLCKRWTLFTAFQEDVPIGWSPRVHPLQIRDWLRRPKLSNLG